MADPYHRYVFPVAGMLTLFAFVVFTKNREQDGLAEKAETERQWRAMRWRGGGGRWRAKGERGERERERDRQTDRDRDTDRQTDRQTETETDRHTDRQTQRQRELGESG